MSDMNASFSASKLNSDVLPPDQTITVSQSEPSGSAKTPAVEPEIQPADPSNPSVSVQPIDPKKEDENDIEDAKQACNGGEFDESNNVDAQYSNDSAKHIRGKKALLSSDFGGNSEINSISDAYGIVVLCGLHVKSYSNGGGKLILIDSKIDSLEGFHGTVHRVGAEPEDSHGNGNGH